MYSREPDPTSEQLAKMERSELFELLNKANEALASIKEQLRMSQEDGVLNSDPGWKVRTLAAKRYKALLVQRIQVAIGKTKKPPRCEPKVTHKNMFFKVAHELLPKEVCQLISEEARRREHEQVD